MDLLGGGGIDCDPSPGRIFLVGPSHTFEQFAEAIDAAFARWDLSRWSSNSGVSLATRGGACFSRQATASRMVCAGT